MMHSKGKQHSSWQFCILTHYSGSQLHRLFILSFFSDVLLLRALAFCSDPARCSDFFRIQVHFELSQASADPAVAC